jgi:Ca2+-binding RTX toxin-like protein
MRRGRIAVLAALAFALAAPAAASAATTLGVENGAIRYVGDNGGNHFEVWPAENGEQAFWVADGTVLGSGCHRRAPDDPSDAARFSNTLCSLSGVSRIEFVGGDGRDVFTAGHTQVTDLPVFADMGPGDDNFEFGSTQTDYVSTGTGNDFYLDGIGNDYVDLGPGDDVVPTAAGISFGDDTILGGDGNDNIDGNTGNDVIVGGRGDDIFQPGDGDDKLDGGPGNDEIGCDDPGNDTVDAGPGDDRVCGGLGSDTIDAGDGNDSVSSFDNQLDGLVSCGAGTDVVWSDPFDPVGLDCEQQGAPRVVVLTTPVLPVALPCNGACSGTTAVFATPNAATPTAGVIPSKDRPVAVGGALAKAKFKLAKHAKRTVRVKLTATAAKRLKKLGKTTVESRTVFTQGGKRYSVRRTFGVKPKK